MAERIVDWFNRNPNPTYAAYAASPVGPESNIVEYEDARLLKLSGQLSVDAMTAKL